jgi:RimJ/RimL family protein N-acetyltransferase
VVTVLAAGELVLRPPLPEDGPDLLAMLMDPEVLRWNAVPEVVDLGSAVEWCARAADWADGAHATFSVLGPDGRFAGSVSIHQIDHVQGTAEIGYRVAPWARGRGIATLALATAAEWAFVEEGLARIQLFHAVDNPASCRVAEKCGFRHEGTLRSSFVYGDGRRHDEHLHARLATDQPARPAEPPHGVPLVRRIACWRD